MAVGRSVLCYSTTKGAFHPMTDLGLNSGIFN